MTVVVFGRASCAPCRTLKYLLDKKKIAYKYIEGGATVFPTIEIDGYRVEGANWSLIQRLLGV